MSIKTTTLIILVLRTKETSTASEQAQKQDMSGVCRLPGESPAWELQEIRQLESDTDSKKCMHKSAKLSRDILDAHRSYERLAVACITLLSKCDTAEKAEFEVVAAYEGYHKILNFKRLLVINIPWNCTVCLESMLLSKKHDSIQISAGGSATLCIGKTWTEKTDFMGPRSLSYASFHVRKKHWCSDGIGPKTTSHVGQAFVSHSAR